MKEVIADTLIIGGAFLFVWVHALYVTGRIKFIVLSESAAEAILWVIFCTLACVVMFCAIALITFGGY